MARRQQLNVEKLIKGFLALPRWVQGLLVILAVVGVGFYLLNQRRTEPEPVGEAAGPGEYLFCFWNAENLFDDQDDDRNQIDEKFDNPFATNPALLREKLDNLSKVILSMNGGKGPDILALAEIENRPAADLLRQHLNKALGDRAPPYEHLVFREVRVGRHIAPAILSRPRVTSSGRDYRVRRILEGHVEAGGRQLVILVGHWTSRVSDEEGTGRAKYADLMYGRFHEMYKANPDIDFLICGDFNDDPTDRSLTEHLHATGDRNALATGGDPRLFNLAAGKDLDKFGTLSHDNRWHLFDQIVVSPGLLDAEGWTCLPETFRTVREPMVNKQGRPWRFDEDFAGRRHYDKRFDGRRGFADHFPVTVRLKVQGR